MLSLRDLLLAMLVVVVWGINFVFMKWGVQTVPPLLLTALRYACAALPAVFFVRRPDVRFSILLAYGLALGVGQFGLLFSAIKLGMPAGLASLVVQVQAFFTIGIAMLVLGERLSRFQALGALVAIIGIGLIASERFEATALVPFLMVLLAALFWGMANVASKKAGKIEMFPFVIWASLVPILPLLALSLVLEGPQVMGQALVGMDLGTLAIIGFNGYFATVLGFGLWSYLLSRYPAGLIAPLSLLVPVVGMGSAYLLLGEGINGLEVAGSALVFAGLLVNVFGSRLYLRWRPV